jgi:hypothetical protein
MIQVRLVFQAKYGRAGELAALMKEYNSDEMPAGTPGPRSVRLLTDLSGPFDTVVQELEFDSFEAWEQGMAAMFAHPRAQEMMARSRELIESGHKEFYTIEA